jgi:3-deoxy-manno-octulosonate cytidylyltransferase (CMP-KDO synthetase)
MAKVLAVIPARYASTRLPGKVLAEVAGRPLVWHVWHQAVRASLVDDALVATDDLRVARALAPLDVPVVMTRADHACGTDRLAEVAARVEADVLVNVQGDEPMIDPRTIDAVVRPLLDDPALPMSTARHAIDDPRDVNDPSVVKVVCDRAGRAMYFSRRAIPMVRDAAPPCATGVPPMPRSPHPNPLPEGEGTRVASPAAQCPMHWQHVGIYAYRRDAVIRFAALPPTPLEQAERLEQLRALEHGWPIAVVETEHRSIGVDTPEDLQRVRQLLAA